MTDAAALPTADHPARAQASRDASRAGWVIPRVLPGFIARRVTGAIIRFQPSLGALAVALCAASGAGLAILVLLSLRGQI